MTKRQTWWFAVGGTLVCSVAFLALTIHSHMRFPELTNSEDLTAEVEHGMEVWHDKNCINCHTLFGEGAYYAPDLTKIADRRGEQYLKAFLKNPSDFYSEDEYDRVMPDQDLTDKEIDQLVAFFEWVSNVDNQGWPPRPIRVTGSGSAPGSSAEEPADSPEAKGRALFNDSEIGCNSCHAIEGGVMVGPSLAGLPSKAADLVESDDYEGDAESAEEYVRESIVEPNAHIVSGENFASDGVSMMPGDYDERLTGEEIDQLVAYLMTLEK